jgi:hypothetical protein
LTGSTASDCSTDLIGSTSWSGLVSLIDPINVRLAVSITATASLGFKESLEEGGT